MSRCEVSIEFDRSDRTYQGGERVAGKVRIQVQEDTRCQGIRLTHFWRTHGRGNPDHGPKDVTLLAEASSLLAGEVLEYPFHVTAPAHPLTYHGRLISVDHYVRVDVDVPWATDPFAEEDYIVRPGRRPAEMTGRRDQEIKFGSESTESSGWFAKGLMIIVVVIILGLVAAFAIILLPIIAVIGIVLWIRSRVIAQRLGNVVLEIPHVLVAPGEPWPLRLAFTPRKSFALNSITVHLVGTESATSGHGTDETTHTHTVCDRKIVLRKGGELRAGEPVRLETEIPFPTTDAFSFSQTGNSVKWSAEVRIDIPSFPDWATTKNLQIVPTEFLNQESPANHFEQDRPAREFNAEHRTDGHDVRPLSERDRALPETLSELERELLAAGRDNYRRGVILSGIETTDYNATILIDRISTSISAGSDASRFADGKSVTGIVVGTQLNIHILADRKSNNELSELRSGDSWQARIRITGWDNLYQRLTAEQAE